RMVEGRSVLYLRLVCAADDHLSVSRFFGKAGGMGSNKSAGAERPDGGQTSLVRIKRQNADSDVSGLQERSEAGRGPSDFLDRLRRIEREPHARVFGADRAVGGDGRSVCAAEPEGRRRVRRAVAQSGDVREQTECV